jgi:hypothetical protein
LASSCYCRSSSFSSSISLSSPSADIAVVTIEAALAHSRSMSTRSIYQQQQGRNTVSNAHSRSRGSLDDRGGILDPLSGGLVSRSIDALELACCWISLEGSRKEEVKQDMRCARQPSSRAELQAKRVFFGEGLVGFHRRTGWRMAVCEPGREQNDKERTSNVRLASNRHSHTENVHHSPTVISTRSRFTNSHGETGET